MPINLDNIIVDVIAAHELDADAAMEAIHTESLQSAIPAYERFASDLRSQRNYHYEPDEGQPGGDNALQQTHEEVMESIEAELKVDVESVLKAQIEGGLVQAGIIEKDAQLFLKPAFAAMAEASLLKVVDESSVKGEIADKKIATFMNKLDDSSPTAKALDLIEKVCNNNPQDEWRKNLDPLFLEFGDMNSMLTFFLDSSDFRREDRLALDPDNKAAKEKFDAACEEEIALLVEQLVPVFESSINADGKFTRLAENAAEVDSVMGQHRDFFSEPILGYEVDHGDERAFQPGLGELAARGQLYEEITPEEVLLVRVERNSETKRSCEKIDPEFESNPDFSGTVKAFRALAKAMFEGCDMDAVRDVLQARQG